MMLKRVVARVLTPTTKVRTATEILIAVVLVEVIGLLAKVWAIEEVRK